MGQAENLEVKELKTQRLYLKDRNAGKRIWDQAEFLERHNISSQYLTDTC